MRHTFLRRHMGLSQKRGPPNGWLPCGFPLNQPQEGYQAWHTSSKGPRFREACLAAVTLRVNPYVGWRKSWAQVANVSAAQDGQWASEKVAPPPIQKAPFVKQVTLGRVFLEPRRTGSFLMASLQ